MNERYSINNLSLLPYKKEFEIFAILLHSSQPNFNALFMLELCDYMLLNDINDVEIPDSKTQEEIISFDGD